MTAPAADITLSDLEMASRGGVKDGEFVLSSMLSADLAFTGGDKYSFLLGFSLELDDIAIVNNQAFPGFRLAQATVKDIFGLPLEFSYFIGRGDDFCTGDEFPSRFGVSPLATWERLITT